MERISICGYVSLETVCNRFLHETIRFFLSRHAVRRRTDFRFDKNGHPLIQNTHTCLTCNAEVDAEAPFKCRGTTLGGAIPLGDVAVDDVVVGEVVEIGDFLPLKASSKTGVVGSVSIGDLSRCCCCCGEGEGVCLKGVVGREFPPLVLLLLTPRVREEEKEGAAGLTDRPAGCC